MSDSTVAEIITLPDDLALSDAYHPEVASQCQPCGEEVGEGWTFDGVEFGPPSPFHPVIVRQRRFTFLEFMALFTDTEKAAIVTSAETSVKLFLLMATGADYIDLEDDRTVQGVSELAALGLIGQERYKTVMSGERPSSG